MKQDTGDNPGQFDDEELHPMVSDNPESAGLTDDMSPDPAFWTNAPTAAVTAAAAQHRLRRGWIGDVVGQSSPSPIAADPGVADAFKLHSRKGAKRVILLEFQGCITEVITCNVNAAIPARVPPVLGTTLYLLAWLFDLNLTWQVTAQML
jgi:hypothetical protein